MHGIFYILVEFGGSTRNTTPLWVKMGSLTLLTPLPSVYFAPPFAACCDLWMTGVHLERRVEGTKAGVVIGVGFCPHTWEVGQCLTHSFIYLQFPPFLLLFPVPQGPVLTPLLEIVLFPRRASIYEGVWSASVALFAVPFFVS